MFDDDNADDSTESRVKKLEGLLLDHRSGVHREAGLALLKKIVRLEECVNKAQVEHDKYLKGATKSIGIEKLKFNSIIEKISADDLAFK